MDLNFTNTCENRNYDKNKNDKFNDYVRKQPIKNKHLVPSLTVNLDLTLDGLDINEYL